MAEKKLSKDEQIGFHKGSLQILAIEQQEFGKIMQAIQAQMKGHVDALKELGIDIVAESKKAMEEAQKQQGNAAPTQGSDDIADRLG